MTSEVVPHIRAGMLNRQVTIQTRVDTKDSFGQKYVTWDTFCTTKALIEPLSGRELEAAQAVHSEVTYRMTIRYRPGIVASMRVLYQDKVFNITDVEDVRMMHRILQIMASEGMNDGR